MAVWLVGCGGEDLPEEGAPIADAPAPAAEPAGVPGVELTLAAWPRIFEGALGDQVTAAEAQALLGLEEAPEVEKSDYSELWRYRWREADGKRRELTLDRMPGMPGMPEATIELNARGYANAAKNGLGEAVDLGEEGVQAFWRPERKKGRLIVFTRTAIFTVGVSGLPTEEGKGIAEKVARHLFETNR
jgi:hypothetical protein